MNSYLLTKRRSYLRVNKDSLLRKFFLPHSVKALFSRNSFLADEQVIVKSSRTNSIKKDIKVNNQKLYLSLITFQIMSIKIKHNYAEVF